MRALLRPLAWCCLGLMTGACGNTIVQACNAMCMTPGASVDIAPFARTHRGALYATLCLADQPAQCSERTKLTAARSIVFLSLPGSSAHAIRIEVTRAGAKAPLLVTTTKPVRVGQSGAPCHCPLDPPPVRVAADGSVSG